MLRHRRRNRPRPAAARDARPFTEPRAGNALDWVGGAGWVDRSRGKLVIEVVLAVHHDQARCLHRTTQAIMHLAETGAMRFPPARFPGGAHAVTMPVDERTGGETRAALERWRRYGEPWQRIVVRIGLGAEPAVEAMRIVRKEAKRKITAVDGRLLTSIEPEAFASWDDQRLVARKGAAAATTGLGDMDADPVYCTGICRADREETEPVISRILAVGRTTREAVTRGSATFRNVVPEHDTERTLGLARIPPSDARTLRQVMNRRMRTSNGKTQRIIQVGLGRADHLIGDGEWEDIPPEEREKLAGKRGARVTINEDGEPQIGDREAEDNA